MTPGSRSLPRHRLIFAALTLALASAARAQTTHTVELQHDAALHEFRFKPARVEARAGDVVVFRVTGGGNHSIVFEDGMPPAARAALSAALPRRVGDLAGPLLGPNAEYRIVIPALPAGEYRFYCLPHRAYDEVGVLVVR